MKNSIIKSWPTTRHVGHGWSLVLMIVSVRPSPSSTLRSKQINEWLCRQAWWVTLNSCNLFYNILFSSLVSKYLEGRILTTIERTPTLRQHFPSITFCPGVLVQTKFKNESRLQATIKKFTNQSFDEAMQDYKNVDFIKLHVQSWISEDEQSKW